MKDYATSIVMVAPSPSDTGTSLTVNTGHGARFPDAPFKVSVFPDGAMPTLDNAEKILVTAKDGDTFTIERSQGDTNAKYIQAGFIISNALFAEDVGKSAYTIWLEEGNAGTEEDFLLAIKGGKGDQGDPGLPGADGQVTSIVAGTNITVDSTDPAHPVVSSTGVGDHGGLTGLGDDDHTQYALADGTRGNFAATNHTHTELHTHTNKAILDAVTAAFTTADETKLDGIQAGAQVNSVTSVAGKTGAVTLAKADVGLGNVDNTSDVNKPLSTAQKTYVDDRGPKMLSGTGSPVGVVTPTSSGMYYIDSNYTNGVTLWVSTGTVNTNWKPMTANTGTRNVTSAFTGMDFSGTGWGAFIYRSENQVTLIITGKTTSGTSGSSTIVYTLPDGFSAYSTHYYNSPLPTSQGTIGIVSAGVGETTTFRHYLANATVVATVITFPTVDAWPTTLPGSAVV